MICYHASLIRGYDPDKQLFDAIDFTHEFDWVVNMNINYLSNNHSLLKKYQHVVIYIKANVAASFILHRKASS